MCLIDPLILHGRKLLFPFARWCHVELASCLGMGDHPLLTAGTQCESSLCRPWAYSYISFDFLCVSLLHLKSNAWQKHQKLTEIPVLVIRNTLLNGKLGWPLKGCNQAPDAGTIHLGHRSCLIWARSKQKDSFLWCSSMVQETAFQATQGESIYGFSQL